jgi:hypothetical protein
VPARPTLVTLPEPAVAHVPSPRQKVELLALVPLFKLVTGRLPVTELERLIGKIPNVPAVLGNAKLFNPVTAELSRVAQLVEQSPKVGFPESSMTAGVFWMSFPVVLSYRAIALSVADDGPTTSPPPAGVIQAPSPRQKVVLPALMPLFK